VTYVSGVEPLLRDWPTIETARSAALSLQTTGVFHFNSIETFTVTAGREPPVHVGLVAVKRPAYRLY